jgi:TP901 family phage tail tape measure protein
MASAEIGALRVRLDMDTGAFVANAKKAEQTVDKLGNTFGISGATIARAATAMAGALASVFTAQQIRHALEYADAMGKAAQSAGMSTQTFSEFNHVAALADLTTEEFSKSLAKLNDNLRSGAGFSNEAGVALAAMGIKSRDAANNVRPLEDLLADVAEKFKSYGDGINKTGLAQDLFGARIGARLVPFLNAGKDGIEALREEARKLGITVSDDAAKQAEHFNDQLKTLSAAARGVAVDIGQFMLPALSAVAAFMIETQKAHRAANDEYRKQTELAKDKSFARSIAETTAELERLKQTEAALLSVPFEALTKRQQRELGTLQVMIKGVQESLNNLRASSIKPFATTVTPEAAEAPDAKKMMIALEKEWAEAVRVSREAIALNQEQVEKYGEALAGLATPMDTYRQKMLDIAQASRAGMTDTVKLQQASVQAWAQMQTGIASSAANLTGALAQLFNKNKGFAYANAIMNTYEAFTRALANPPGPPFSYVNAAAALVSGMAQVRAIASTQPGAGGGGGGGGGGATPAPAAPAAAPAGGSLSIQGVDPAALYGGKQLAGLIEAINDAVKNGATLISTRGLPV